MVVSFLGGILDLLDHARFKLLSIYHCIAKTALTQHACKYMMQSFLACPDTLPYEDTGGVW